MPLYLSNTTTMKPGCRKTLPGDLVWDILTRVLVSSSSKTILARFQCVCKTWQSYISSPPFKHDLLVSTKIDGSTLRISTYNSQGTLVINKFGYRRLPKLTRPPFQAVRGLMCFAGGDSGYTDEILVFNPFTGELETLPPPPPPIRGYTSHISVGFGYVASTNEFKVVRFFLSRCKEDITSPKYCCQVLTLSLTGGCSGWREVETPRPPPYLLMISARFQPPFLHGALHLLPPSQHLDTPIVSFDLETEQYKEIQLPPHLHYYDKRTFLRQNYERLTELQGFLCLAVQVERHLALWLLKDYHHDSRTWVKEYNIDTAYFVRAWPCAILNDGCVFFVKYRRRKETELWCYDPRDNSISVPIFGRDCLVTLYEERFLPPLGQICAPLVDRDTGHHDQANQ